MPVVGHVARVFLAPTETFVWNQVRTLERHTPVAFCRRREPSFDFPFEVVSVADVVSPAARSVDDVSYRAARHLTRRAATALATAAERRSVELLHFHFLVDARFFLRFKRSLGVPAIVSGYGYDVSLFPRSFGGFGKRYLAPLFAEIDRFLAMSEDMKEDMLALGCPPQKVVVHYYGTDTDRFAAIPRTYDDPAVVNVLSCGRLQAKKGPDRLLRALHLWEQGAGDRRRPFRVTLVGDGPMRAELEALVSELGWRDRVTFLGHVPHEDPRLLDEYARADVFALPSVTANGEKEGIPGTIVEAMAAGLPVVSTFHAGIPAVVQDGLTGLLVPEHDLDALAAALGRAVTDAALRAELGTKAARSAGAELRLQEKTPELEAIYDDVLSRTGAR